MFQIDVDCGDSSNIIFPTFEEVPGLTDLGIMRKEAFTRFDIGNREPNSGRVRLIAQGLVFLVAKLLDFKLEHLPSLHRKLVAALRAANEPRNMVFVSTNYDIITDNALTEEHVNHIDLDYGIEFRNFGLPDDWARPALDSHVDLYKPHGSLNWLFCPTCQSLERRIEP